MCLGYVCVMEMEWFEMTLRLCNNSQCEQDYQKVSAYNFRSLLHVHVPTTVEPVYSGHPWDPKNWLL